MEKAEYQEYLASREWAEKKEAVKKRANGICERCRGERVGSTHHLTYQNVGSEPLDDLMGVCGKCHTYLSGKSKVDPLRKVFVWKLPYLRGVLGTGNYESPGTDNICEMAVTALDHVIRSELNIAADYMFFTGGIPYSSSMGVWAGAYINKYTLLASHPGMQKSLGKPEWVIEFDPKTHSIINVRQPTKT